MTYTDWWFRITWAYKRLRLRFGPKRTVRTVDELRHALATATSATTITVAADILAGTPFTYRRHGGRWEVA